MTSVLLFSALLVSLYALVLYRQNTRRSSNEPPIVFSWLPFIGRCVAQERAPAPRTHVRTHTHTHTSARARAHTHTHTHTSARTHTHKHACTHARTHTRTHTHAHARTRTHTIKPYDCNAVFVPSVPSPSERTQPRSFSGAERGMATASLSFWPGTERTSSRTRLPSLP